MPNQPKTLEAVTLTGLTRRDNTASGNPRFMVHTSKGSYPTADDSQVNHALSEAMVGKTVNVQLDERDKVRRVSEVSQ